eukprot:gene18696-25217_t
MTDLLPAVPEEEDGLRTLGKRAAPLRAARCRGPTLCPAANWPGCQDGCHPPPSGAPNYFRVGAVLAVDIVAGVVDVPAVLEIERLPCVLPGVEDPLFALLLIGPGVKIDVIRHHPVRQTTSVLGKRAAPLRAARCRGPTLCPAANWPGCQDGCHPPPSGAPNNFRVGAVLAVDIVAGVVDVPAVLEIERLPCVLPSVEDPLFALLLIGPGVKMVVMLHHPDTLFALLLIDLGVKIVLMPVSGAPNNFRVGAILAVDIVDGVVHVTAALGNK